MAAGPVVREMHLFKRDSAFVWAFFIGAAVIFLVKNGGNGATHYWGICCLRCGYHSYVPL